MSIKFYGKSQEVCERILEQFKTGNLPIAISPIFVNRSDNVPSSAWSFCNRFIMSICGTHDARGFKQWQTVGRKIKAGAKAFHILGPCIINKEDKDSGEKTPLLIGFKSIPVFAIESTEVFDNEKWLNNATVDHEEETRLANLPLRDVADKWGLNVTSYNGEKAKYLGYYSHGGTIALGVENIATWAHELMHAADHRNGTITKAPGQQPDNEIVAEFGGATILEIMGYHRDADLGGAWEYIKSYAGNDNDKAIRKSINLINRICGCIDLIIKTAIGDNEEVKKAA